MIKFLFINAINPYREIEKKYPPLGIGYLVSSLREGFGENSIKFKIIEDSFEEKIKEFKPDIVGITSVSQNYNRVIEAARIAKKYGLPVICGGVHISMMPTSLTKDMEVGVLGEGEETLCELFSLFRNRSKLDREGLEKIQGIIFRDKNGEIYLTPPRKSIFPLDRIPLPARDLFEINPNNAYMFTSRGCPYRCTFCASSRFWNTVRFFSAPYVVNEIKHLVERYGVKHIAFYDDLFIANLERLKNIVDLLEKEGLLKNITFSCQARANLITDEIVQLLKRMNINSIGIGFESGCNRTLQYLKGENVTIEDNLNAIRIIKKYKIKVHGSFIVGSPQETKENILETLKFVQKNPLDGFDVYVLTPFPGTPIWGYAKSRNLVNDKMDWDKLNVNFSENYRSAIILSEKLKREELYNLYQLFQQEKKRRRIHLLIKKGLKNPLKIPNYFLKKIILK
jgi:magnesium-protoporphyrin IX monomethyl ester (oxidative) cyclase